MDAVNPPLRVLIVDDEELARTRLKTLVAECAEPRARVVGEAASSALALGWLEHNSCDVLLLDIQMPGADGRQLSRLLRQRSGPGHPAPAVVFVTAHAEHALEAFELDAVDYLTKPVRRERLATALQRVAQRRAASSGAAAPASPSDEPVIVVSDRGRVVRVPLSQVIYLRAEQKYVTVRTREREHLIEESLIALEREFSGPFVRIHRNCLVARSGIRGFERTGGGDEEAHWQVVLDGVVERLPVSRRQWPTVRELIADKN